MECSNLTVPINVVFSFSNNQNTRFKAKYKIQSKTIIQKVSDTKHPSNYLDYKSVITKFQ